MYYAVAVGKTPGIYDTWNLTKININGFKGAKYKKFETLEECYNFIKQYNPEFYAMYKLSLRNLFEGESISEKKRCNSSKDSKTEKPRVVSPKCEPASKQRSSTPNLELDIIKNDLLTKCDNKNKQLLSTYFKINLDDLFDSKKDKLKLSTDDILSILKNVICNIDNDNDNDIDNKNLQSNKNNKKVSRYFLNEHGDVISIDISKTKTTMLIHNSFIHNKVVELLNKLMDDFIQQQYCISEIIYTDGSLKRKGVGNISKFGYYRNTNISITQPMIPETTNNQCELLAIYTALVDIYIENMSRNYKPHTNTVKIISIVTDSEYSINSLTKWKDSWIKNKWRNSKNEPVKNRNILEAIIMITKKLYKIKIIVNYIHQNSHIKLETLCELNKELQCYISNEYNSYLKEKRNIWTHIKPITYHTDNSDNVNDNNDNDNDNDNDNSDNDACRVSPSSLLNISTYVNNNIENYQNILNNINSNEYNLDFYNIIKCINTIEFIKGNYIIDFLVQN
jgi:ribonuclease HI/viroplasmin and RNaseH domain-containing protein